MVIVPESLFPSKAVCCIAVYCVAACCIAVCCNVVCCSVAGCIVAWFSIEANINDYNTSIVRLVVGCLGETSTLLVGTGGTASGGGVVESALGNS